MALLYDNSYQNYSKAIEYYNLAIKTDPNFVSAFVNLALTYYTLGQKDKTIEIITKAIELEPENHQFIHSRGTLFQEKEEWELALSDFKKASELDVTNHRYFQSIAWILSEMKDYENSILTYEKSLEYVKSESERAFNLVSIGILYEKALSEIDKSITYYKKAIEADSTYNFSYLNLGDAYFKLGKNNLAIENYNKGIEIDSTLEDGFFRRIHFYTQIGEYDLALNDIKTVRKIDNEHPESYFKEAIINNKLGKLKSILNIQKAIDKFISYSSEFNESPVIFLDFRSFVNNSERVRLHDLYYFMANIYKENEEFEEYCTSLNNGLNSFLGEDLDKKSKMQNLIYEFCN